MSTRTCIVVLVALSILCFAMKYTEVEMLALMWHARHGFHAELGEIRVSVPLLYEADGPDGTATLMLSKFAGTFRSGSSFIIVSFRKQPSQEAVQAAEAMLAKKGMTRTKLGERMVKFAGRPGTCVEFISKTGDARLDEFMRRVDARDIDCWFGDVEVTFSGTASLRDDFYNIIQTAQPIGRKN